MKLTLNKMKKTALITTAVALSMGAIAPPSAHAVLAFGRVHYNVTILEALAQGVLCVIFLPLCLFDEKVDGVPSLSQQDLADNGYSGQEIEVIAGDYQKLQKAAVERGVRLEVQSGDTRETLSQDIRWLVPDASSTFLDFYTRQATAR